MEDYLGWIAGAFVTLSLVPQIVRVFKLRSAREISLMFNTLILIGTFLWLSYGVMIARNPIIIWNSIGAILITLLLFAKLRYGMTWRSRQPPTGRQSIEGER